MSNGFDVDVADDFEGESNFLSKPGTYHLVVEDVKVGIGPKGNAIEGATFSMAVIAGTVDSEKKKTFNHVIFFPRATHKDGGKFAGKVLSKFLLAVNQVNPADRGKKISVDPERIAGQQIVAAFVQGKENDQGKSYLEIYSAGLAVYHVDDPHVTGIPKDAAALTLIPKELRHDAKWFDQVYAKSGPVSPASKTDSAAATQQPKVDISSL